MVMIVIGVVRRLIHSAQSKKKKTYAVKSYQDSILQTAKFIALCMPASYLKFIWNTNLSVLCHAIYLYIFNSMLLWEYFSSSIFYCSTFY